MSYYYRPTLKNYENVDPKIPRCRCGNPAPSCDNKSCTNCCSGCSLHKKKSVQAIEILRCSTKITICSGIVTPMCDNKACGTHCTGCSYHTSAVYCVNCRYATSAKTCTNKCCHSCCLRHTGPCKTHKPVQKDKNAIAIKSSVVKATPKKASNLSTLPGRSRDYGPNYMDQFVAAKNNNIEKLRYYFEELKIGINDVDDFDNTALYYGCLCNHDEAVEYLFSQNAKIDLLDFDGQRAYLCTNSFRIKELLRTYGQNGKEAHQEHFFAACRFGNLDGVIGALSQTHDKVDVHARSRAKLYGLDYAILQNFDDVADMLIKSYNAPKSIHSDMYRFLKFQKECDLLIEHKNKKFYVHSFIFKHRVKSASKIFRKKAKTLEENVVPLGKEEILNDQRSDQITSTPSASKIDFIFEVLNPTISEEVLSHFITYIYTGTFLLRLNSRDKQIHQDLKSKIAVPLQLTHLSSVCDGTNDIHSIIDPSYFQDMKKVFNSREKDKANLTLVHRDVKYQVHKTFLCARSEYFNSMMISGMEESRSDVVELNEDVTSNAFQMSMEFLYTEEIIESQVDSETAMDLIALASKWLIFPLKLLCEGILTKNFSLDEDDAIQFYSFAELHNSVRLKNMAVDALKKGSYEKICNSEIFISLPTRTQEILKGRILGRKNRVK